MSDFALDIRAFVDKAKGNADQVVRKIGTDVLSSVVLLSPVRTGRFRGNWNVSFDSPDETTTDALDPTGEGTINTQTVKLDAVSVGRTVYLTNALPYAQRLEAGYSKQAPFGMLAITVTRWQEFVNNAVQTLP